MSNLILAPDHNTRLCACVISWGSRKRFQNFLSDKFGTKTFKFVHDQASYFGNSRCSTLHSFPMFGYSFIYPSLQLAHLGCPAVAATWPVSYCWADQMCSLPPTSRGHVAVTLQRLPETPAASPLTWSHFSHCCPDWSKLHPQYCHPKSPSGPSKQAIFQFNTYTYMR